MSIREGSYTIPAQAAQVSRAARQLQSAFDDVFRRVPETERNIPRRSVRKFCRTILTGEQPASVYYRRELREYPGSRTPDGDKYSYRIHTVDVRISGGYSWAQTPEASADFPAGTPQVADTSCPRIPDTARPQENVYRRDGEPKRVLKLDWRMESTYVYHAILDGQDVAGTLHEVWQAQCAQPGRTTAEIAGA